MSADAPPPQRGYFAMGAERISKQMNLGNLVRSAHGFGASFVFTIAHAYKPSEALSDTSRATEHLPLYNWPSVEAMQLPLKCALVGIELLDEAIELPSFRHPLRAAYVLGPERGSLSPELVARCDYVVKIPTSFCVNVAMAGAIVMYDRAVTLGRFPPRPVGEGGPIGEGGPEREFAPHALGGRRVSRGSE